MSDRLGDRIKNNYENRSRYYLARRTPVIVRMDGKAFHTHLAKANKPFDDKHISAMGVVSLFLLENIQGAKAVYTQSDEISLLLTDYDTLETSAYLDYNKSKLESILASYTSVQYNKNYGYRFGILTEAIFDARAFNIPKEEVVNYFLWRARDWERNSLFMYANSFYSHKELEGKKPQINMKCYIEKV